MKNNQFFFMKHILCFIVTILITSLAHSQKSEQFNKQEKKLNWINFEWQGSVIDNRHFDKVAISIPFTIEGVPHKFNSQFDLGAFKTMVYGNSIKPYLEEYPDFTNKLDTLNKTHVIPGGKAGAFKNVNFKLDKVEFKNQELVYFEKFGDVFTKDSVNTNSIKHIGTIGPDFFQDKYLIMDFSKQRIATLDKLNDSYKQRTTFVDVKLDKGRIKIPVTINDVTQYFMFDTGSSMFPLIVEKEDIHKISKSITPNDTLKVSSWGTLYDVHSYAIDSNIAVGGIKMKTQNLNVFDTKKEYKQFFDSEGIMGIMGNAFFLDREIIIDYRNKGIGIVQ